MICSNMSLRWVPYPTQVIGKSAKPIPVMILGVLIGRKHYPLRKYFFIFLIVIGIVLFMYKDSAAAASKTATSENASIIGIGEILLLLSLTMDGLTGAVQVIFELSNFKHFYFFNLHLQLKIKKYFLFSM